MLRQSRLNAAEKRLLSQQLENSARPARHSTGKLPPLVLLPLLPFLPMDWVIWENSGQGYLAQGLGKLNGNVVIETRETVKSADALVAAPRLPYPALVEAYQTLKPFALLLPVEVLGLPGFQAMFQSKGLEIILFDRMVTGNHPGPLAWFCWSLPGLEQLVTYAHIPPDERLLEWMYQPTSRADIRKG